MVKAMTLTKRKPGLSREEFIRHYEEVHVPLGLKYFPTMKRYVRNYVITPPDAKELDFDCITEYWYDSMDDLEAAVRFWQSDLEGAQVVRDDELSFRDESETVWFLVEEKVTK